MEKKFVISDSDKCTNCQGYKVVKESKILTVEIEPGMQVGQQISFYGESDQFPDTITGDVIFVLRPAQETSIFTRSGNDLHCKKEVTLIEALSGIKFILKHLDDRELLITTDEIVQPGEKRKVIKQGMPVLNKPEKFGDLYVEFTVVLPTQLTKEQVTNLQKILPLKPLQYNENQVIPCSLQKISESEEKHKQQKQQQQQEEEDGHHQGGVQCQQQ